MNYHVREPVQGDILSKNCRMRFGRLKGMDDCLTAEKCGATGESPDVCAHIDYQIRSVPRYFIKICDRGFEDLAPCTFQRAYYFKAKAIAKADRTALVEREIDGDRGSLFEASFFR